MSSLGFANTLYAQMLRARDLDRQRRLEQQREDREYTDKALQRNLDEQRLTERAKELEFTRHLRVAESEARAASLRGRGSAPTGYYNPAIEEAARVAFETGQVDRDNLMAERGQKQLEQEVELAKANMNYRGTLAGHASGLEKSGYAELSDFGREELLPALYDPSAPLPSGGGPISRRLSPEEILKRQRARSGKSADYDMEEALPMFKNVRDELNARKLNDPFLLNKSDPMRNAWQSLWDLSRLYMDAAWQESGGKPNTAIEQKYYNKFLQEPEVQRFYKTLSNQQLHTRLPPTTGQSTPTTGAQPDLPEGLQQILQQLHSAQ